jgi:type IV pilus assembly protein PilV
MIELLVALVIFAFGTLGLAGLQTQALAFSQGSLYRSQATALTDDILDRMRTDRTNAKGGAWNTALNETAASIASPVTIARIDIKDWKDQVEALLPAGQASIAVNAGVVTVTLQWDDSRGERQAAVQSFVTQSQI